MENNSFEQKVKDIDWTKYLNPKFHDPNKMDFDPNELVETLIELNQIEDSESNSRFLSKARYAFGNDHRGTYYPAALEAIDLIILVEKTSANELAQKYARCILNDLHYFQLEMSDGDEDLYDSISNSIKEKLKPYSDENLEIGRLSFDFKPVKRATA